MSLETEVQARSQSKCELCGSTDGISVYKVPMSEKVNADSCIMACETCKSQLESPEKIDPNHWRCLNDSAWSTVPAVQVMAWRMLNRIKGEAWPQDLLDMLYLEEDTLLWAQATGEGASDDDAVKHIDSNGAVLMAGDTVILTKDLNVKGANFTAKRGTAVRNIILVADNAEHIEGKVEGQQIVILTKYVKKA